jgi:polyphosphate kinase
MQQNRYFNRELSWIEFNARVLEEALKPTKPLLERLSFLGIVSSNFDEFFMVRVAALKAAISDGTPFPDPFGADLKTLLAKISARVHEISAKQDRCLLEDILPSLKAESIDLVHQPQWTSPERHFLEMLFTEKVFPLLTPLRIETDIFPSTGNLRVHVAFSLADENETVVSAIVQVPSQIGRFIQLPPDSQENATTIRYALLEDLISAFGSRLFPGYKILGSILFKVTRDADSGVDEDKQDDFLMAMEEVLAGRQNSFPVRLTWAGDEPALAATLRTGLGLTELDEYRRSELIDLTGFQEFMRENSPSIVTNTRFKHLFDKSWPPIDITASSTSSIWDEVDRGDRLIHLPYESFSAIQRLLDEAANDPSVLAIKMTLYRTSGDSPVVHALTRAARNGKQVAVVVELKARFDEERNITWAERLEQAGAIVTYGVARLKVHAKAALIIRRAKDGSIRKYLHMSTGNYNDRTARVYSDLSILTANEELCREASIFFNIITGYSSIQSLRYLVLAPFELKKRLLFLIDREAKRSTPEMPGLIEAKLNSLADTDIVEALYSASRAGVRIFLNVRGACTLVPGVPGQSETIEVRSVLGRFLEHGRMLYLQNGGMSEMYLSSADWLPRNLDRRIELMFPVLDDSLRTQCKEILDMYFKDNTHSYRLLPDGSWMAVRPKEGEKPLYAQEQLYKRVKRIADISETPKEQLQVRRRFKIEPISKL